MITLKQQQLQIQQQQQQKSLKLSTTSSSHTTSSLGSASSSSSLSGSSSSTVPATDSFVNSLIQELKTIKMNNNCNNQSNVDGIMPLMLGGESSIKKQNSNINSIWMKPSPLWNGSPQSPTSSITTQYHNACSSHSNSKESLWHSTQSSPNSNAREQFQAITPPQQQQTHIWENASKMPNSSCLNQKNPLGGSIWSATPPESMHSSPPPPLPAQLNKLSNLWDTQNSTNSSAVYQPIKPDLLQLQHQQYHKNNGYSKMARPKDIVQSDNIWNINGVSGGNKTKEPVGSLWAQPTPSNYPNSSVNPKLNGSSKTAAVKSTRAIAPYRWLPSPAPNTNTSAPAPTAAASSCLQLFSDDFLNYLNMIN